MKKRNRRNERDLSGFSRSTPLPMEQEHATVRRAAKRLSESARRYGVVVDPEDLSGDTMLRYFEIGGDSRVDLERGSVISLLLGIQHNVFREHLRKAMREVRLRTGAARQEIQDEVVIERLLRDEEMAWLPKALSGLSKREREGLIKVARALLGFAVDGVPSKSDFVAACRARKHLREMARRKGLLD